MLLRESLGNVNCRTTMIAHISAAAGNYAETLSTIQIASRVLRMKKKKTKVRGLLGVRRRKQLSETCPGTESERVESIFLIPQHQGPGELGCRRPGSASTSRYTEVLSPPTTGDFLSHPAWTPNGECLVHFREFKRLRLGGETF